MHDSDSVPQASYLILYTFITFIIILVSGSILNCLLMLTWLAKQEEWSNTQIANTTVIIVLFSVFSYMIIAIQYSVSRTYTWLYNKLLKKWIPSLAELLTELVWEKKKQLQYEIAGNLKQAAKESDCIEDKAFYWLNAQIHTLPTPLAKIVAFFLKLTPIKDWVLFLDTNWMKNTTTPKELTQQLTLKIDRFMQTIPTKAFPFWTKLLLPINLLLILFFILS